MNTHMEDDTIDDVAEKRVNLENLIQREKDLKDEKDLEDLKRSAMAELAELTDILQSAPSKDTIHSALRHIRAAKSVARGLAVIGTDHQYMQTRSFPPNKLAEKEVLLNKKKEQTTTAKTNSLRNHPPGARRHRPSCLCFLPQGRCTKLRRGTVFSGLGRVWTVSSVGSHSM